MSSEETEVEDPVDGDRGAAQPDWWHRDHPTFSALTGFFTGLLFVLVVPATFVGVLSLLFDDNSRVEELFPLVLVTLVVPLFLVISQKSRRFGTYMWIGIVTTALVVGGVGALVSVGLSVWLPIALDWSLERYGLIGSALALQSTLLVEALAVVAGAVVGATLVRPTSPAGSGSARPHRAS